MGTDRHIGDAEVERFLADLRSSFPAQAPATSEAHLAAMFETAHLLADNGDPVVRPVSNADAPAAQVSRLPKRRRNTMTERNFRARALRIAAPTIAAFTVLGAMAAANALPRPVQHAASTVAGFVGLDVPDTQDTPDVQDTTGDQTPDAFGTTTTDPTQDTTDATSQDSQGDNNNQDSTDTSTSTEDNQGDSTDSTDTSASTEDSQGDNNNQDSTDTSSSSQDNQGDSTDSTDTSTSQDNQGDSTDTSGSQDSSGSGSDSGSGDSNTSDSQN